MSYEDHRTLSRSFRPDLSLLSTGRRLQDRSDAKRVVRFVRMRGKTSTWERTLILSGIAQATNTIVAHPGARGPMAGPACDCEHPLAAN